MLACRRPNRFRIVVENSFGHRRAHSWESDSGLEYWRTSTHECKRDDSYHVLVSLCLNEPQVWTMVVHECIADSYSRHEFYETEEKLTISIFDRGADPGQVAVKFDARKVYINSSLNSYIAQIILGLLWKWGQEIAIRTFKRPDRPRPKQIYRW